MAVVIRLKRIGAKKKPAFRIAVADARCPRDGRNLEEIGAYDLTRNPAFLKVDKERATYWLGKGAQPSHSVKMLFKKCGVV